MVRTKNAIHIPRLVGGGGGGRKLVGLLITAAVLWWIIDDPVGAASDVGTVVDSIVTFFRGLRA